MTSRLLYAGSVKNVYELSPETVRFEFTDDYSVFDWGKMPDTISNKGNALAEIGAYFFEKLSSPKTWTGFYECSSYLKKNKDLSLKLKPTLELFATSGVLNHYLKRTGTNSFSVRKCEIYRPNQTLENGKYKYEYPIRTSDKLSLIPLEVVFRFGAPIGSSILDRFPDMNAGTRFVEPMIELYTKLEDRDRLLHLDEALKISGLSIVDITQLIHRTQTIAIYLHDAFSEIGLELWDGKLEWAIENDEFVLVDSIGPDELRLIDPVTELQLSKEYLRSYYRNTDWYRALNLEKKRGGDWKDRMKKSGRNPEFLPIQQKRTVEMLYSGLASWITNSNNGPSLSELRLQMNVKKIKVAVLGSGGREHALSYKLLKSNFVENVICIPGNAGMEPEIEIDLGIKLFDDQGNFNIEPISAKCNGYDLIVVGPDDCLAAGAVNLLKAKGFSVFGPSKDASKLEWSKSFAKEIMIAANIPTARYFEVNNIDTYLNISSQIPFPQVVKYDGLALGKGVRICKNQDEVLHFLKEIFEEKKFSQLLRPVLIEKYLEGREVSLFAICDGIDWEFIGAACDYKKLLDGNQGPNTGGMGAYSPVPWLSEEKTNEISEKIFTPVLQEMKKRGIHFSGILYAGLMISNDLESFSVLEFNTRFGDPETQVLMMRLESDLAMLLYNTARENLNNYIKSNPIRFNAHHAMTVAAVSEGYPEKPIVNKPLHINLKNNNIKIFTAGLKKQNNQFVTSGGRVYYATTLNDQMKQAQKDIIEFMQTNQFEGMQYRKDIGDL